MQPNCCLMWMTWIWLSYITDNNLKFLIENMFGIYRNKKSQKIYKIVAVVPFKKWLYMMYSKCNPVINKQRAIQFVDRKLNRNFNNHISVKFHQAHLPLTHGCYKIWSVATFLLHILLVSYDRFGVL